MKLTWHPWQCEFDGDWTFWLRDPEGNTVATLSQHLNDAESYRLSADFMKTQEFRALDRDLAQDEATKRVMERLATLASANVETYETR